MTEETQIPCDDKCKEAKNKKSKGKELEENKRREAELHLQQEELEKFERKKQGRKRKPRQGVQNVETDEGMLTKHKYAIGFTMLLLGIFIAFCYQLFVT